MMKPLLDGSLLPSHLEGFIAGLGGPAGARDLVDFEVFQRLAHHGIRHGLGEGVLMLFGDGRERMADYAHIGHVLILDGQMHIDGVFADRTVLAVNRIGAVGVIAGVFLVGLRGIRVVGMIFDGIIVVGGVVGGLTVGFGLVLLRFDAFAGVAGILVVHRRGFRLATGRKQRKARRGQGEHIHSRRFLVSHSHSVTPLDWITP